MDCTRSFGQQYVYSLISNWTRRTFLVLTLLLVISSLDTEGAIDYRTYYLANYCEGHSYGSSINLKPSGRDSAATIKYTQHKTILSRLARDCQLVVRAPEDYDVIVSVREVKLRGTFGDCGRDTLNITTPVRGRSYCSIPKQRWEKEVLKTEGVMNYVILNISHGLSVAKRSFEVIVTAAKRGSCPNSSEFFQCSNNLCVSKILKCDGHNNCGDRSDEENQDCNVVTRGSLITVLIVIGLIVLIGGIAIYYIIKKRRGARAATTVIENSVDQPLQPAYQPTEPQPYPAPQGYPPPGGPPPPGMMVPPAGYPGYQPPMGGMQPYPVQSPYNPAPIGAGGFGATTVAPPPPDGSAPPGPYPPPGGYPPPAGGYPPYGGAVPPPYPH